MTDEKRTTADELRHIAKYLRSEELPATAGEVEDAAKELDALTAERDALREALRPFAQMLERYDLDLRPLIALVDDDTGARLNVSHADVWRAASAALKGET